MRLRCTRRLALLSFICTTVCSTVGITPTALAQVSSVDAMHLGLEIAWQSQVQIPQTGRGITTSSLWVDTSVTRKYAVVELEAGRTIEVSASEVDDKGVPIGIEAAKQIASERAARLLGRNDGFEVIESNIPDIRLVVSTSDGLVQTFDAETGMLLWSRPCGQTTAPAQAAALSPNGVSLIHGRHLYLLDWPSGKQLLRQELKYGSSIALAVCGKLAYVTDFRGRLEAYGLGIRIKPWTSQISGRAVGQPVSLADQSYCAFASTDGFLYTMLGGEKPGMWTRYEAAAPFSGCLAAGNQAFYAGSIEGVIAKVGVDDKLGNLNWDFTTGEPLTASPLVVGERVYVANESGRMHCIDDQNGNSIWSEVGLRVVQPLAVASGKLYCTTLAGEIVAVNAENGRFLASSSAIPIAATVVNQVSDRLYVADTSGRLQCLRPIQSTLPRLVQPVTAGEVIPDQNGSPATPPTTPAAASQDPFNFGGDAAAPANSNPFGAAGDPFGAPAPAGDTTPDVADPFGTGASDPFAP